MLYLLGCGSGGVVIEGVVSEGVEVGRGVTMVGVVVEVLCLQDLTLKVSD